MHMLGSVLFYSLIFDEITLTSFVGKYHGVFVGERCRTLLPVFCHRLEGWNNVKSWTGKTGADTQLFSRTGMWGFCGSYSSISDWDVRPRGPSDQVLWSVSLCHPFGDWYHLWAYIQSPRMLAPCHLKTNGVQQTICRFAQLRAGQRLMGGLVIWDSSFLIVSGMGHQPNRCHCWDGYKMKYGMPSFCTVRRHVWNHLIWLGQRGRWGAEKLLPEWPRCWLLCSR